MLSPEIRARLSRLNRVTLPDADQPSPSYAPSSGSMSELPAGEQVDNGCGQHWLLRTAIDELWPAGADVIEQTLSDRDPLQEPSNRAELEIAELQNAFPEQVLLLDLETCGLSGAMVFLVGLIHVHQGQFVLSQLLARNYAEEAAILQSLWEIAAAQQVLVTFNGKSFDWPLVHDRSTLHHLGRDPRQSSCQPTAVAGETIPARLARHQPRPELVHCDLLHHGRRRWKSQLPDCRLQTLEQYICGRYRSGDIPGRLIPHAYHDYVRTGDAWQMRNVLHHNALDLVTLLELSCRFIASGAEKKPSFQEEC